MALNNISEEIKLFLDRLKEHMTNPPDGEYLNDFNLDEHIDQHFNLESVTGELVDYWNESLTELLKNFNDKIEEWKNNPYDPEIELSQIHDAAYDFEEKYVSPNPNLAGQTYQNARTDEIENVLQNFEKLDYTIDLELVGEFKNYVTRLMMPQYQRRVEVEDLNRNFWVIGQNLSLLNKLILDINKSPWLNAIKDIIAEISGLWENVYRIWQVILHLAKEVDKTNDGISEIGRAASKTKIKLAYSCPYGQFENFNNYTNERVIDRLYQEINDEQKTMKLSELFLFQSGDSAFFGMLPYIEKSSVEYEEGKYGMLYYLPYNKTISDARLNSMSDLELDKRFIIGHPDGGPRLEGELIGIERRIGNTPARDFLKIVQAKNFVLVSPQPVGKIPILDNLVTVYDPILQALQFYRDFIYSVKDIEHNAAFGSIVENTFRWKQGGYIEYLNFSEEKVWNDSDIISENIFNSFIFLKKIIINKLNSNYNSFFIDILSLLYQNQHKVISELKQNLLDSRYNLENLIEDFYKLYNICIDFLSSKGFEISSNEAPYFIDNSTDRIYSIDTNQKPESFCLKFRNLTKEYNLDQSSDNNGTFSYIPTAFLFADLKDYFDENSNSRIKYKDNYYRLVLGDTHSIEMTEPSPVIKWDLMSNTLAVENFYLDDNITDDSIEGCKKRTFSKDFDTRLTNSEAVKNNLIDVVAETNLRGGWWNLDKPNCLGSSYLHYRTDTFGVWFEFVADPTKNGLKITRGEIVSLTLNEAYWSWLAGNPTLGLTGPVWNAHHIYNTDLTVPFIGVEDRPYWDFIRLGKPYPSITQLIKSRVENDSYSHYLDTLNKESNFIGYDNVMKGQSDGAGYCVDGFYGFDNLNNYPYGNNPLLPLIPYKSTQEDVHIVVEGNQIKTKTDVWRKREKDGQVIDYFGSAFIGNLTYEVASCDLVNAYLESNGSARGGVSEGFTRIKNRNEINEPIINISYLSGETQPQEISIFVSKDITQGVFTKKIEEEINIEGTWLCYDEFDTNNSFGLPYKNSFNREEDGIDFFACKEKDNIISYDVNRKGEEGICDSTIDLNEHQYNSNGNTYNFYRQKISLKKKVTGGYILHSNPQNSITTNTENKTYKDFLTTEDAKTMIQNYINNQSSSQDKTHYFILSRIIYNHFSTYGRTSKPQTAGIYLGYIAIAYPNGEISLVPIHRVMAPGTICENCQNKFGKDYKHLVFIQQKKYYGHIHTYENTNSGTTWGMAAYAEIQSINHLTKDLNVKIYCADIAAFYGNTQQSAGSFQELRNKYNLQDIKENPSHIYATIQLTGQATKLTEENVELNDINTNIEWHTHPYPYMGEN